MVMVMVMAVPRREIYVCMCWRIWGFVSGVEDVGMVGYFWFGVGIWGMVVIGGVVWCGVMGRLGYVLVVRKSG